ncbi:MAG: glycerophosphoryl diester phosphodiesterase membrane domain-containing protein [Synechococcales cyanobacterium M58_A2018_015]|nr:glycerophosphoryl diester phosphodiesterase membrane domain-containing protein [Synechococcales cyanobacterium M58_A2018_015]
MALSSDPQGSIRPLSAGNVVSAGLRLYSSHFSQYFGVAVVATLWILLPIVLLALLVGFFVVVRDYDGLLGLLVPAWIVLLLYCSGKYLAGSAAISRLAYGELIHHPESTRDANRYTQSRLWGFVAIGLLLGLLYTAVALGFYFVVAVVAIALLIALGGFAALQGGSFEQALANDPLVAASLVLLVLAVIVCAILLFSWLSARVAVAELPLAIESEIGASRSIGRSWELTQKHAWRIVLILFITFLITLPLQILAQIISSLLQAALTVTIPPDSALFTGVTLLISYIIGLASGVFLLPLWQAIKAVIYYDLRSRREGLDLQLRDRPSESI